MTPSSSVVGTGCAWTLTVPLHAGDRTGPAQALGTHRPSSSPQHLSEAAHKFSDSWYHDSTDEEEETRADDSHRLCLGG